MKKKLLKTAAIASFLTSAGVVIPQTDIFAADTPYAPHPSTLPGAQPSNAPHPSTLPSDQPSNAPRPSTVPSEEPSANTNSTENIGVKEWSKLYDKKKVDSFADYFIESITRDKNYITVKTKDNAEVYHATYMDEDNIKEQADNYLIPEKVASNIYRFNTDELVRGKGENKKFSLSGIDLGDFTYDKNGYIFSKVRDINGNVTESVAYAPVIKLNAIDLYKYADVTRVVGSKAIVEKDPKLPEVGDKDYVVYTDKSQVELNGTIKTTVKYKPGVKKYSEVLNEKYVGKDKNGLLGFENIFSTAEHLTITRDKDEQNGSFVGWYFMDKNGNDVFYSSLKGVNPGHYNITRLFGLDITKGNFDNADFTITAGGKSVYRTAKVTSEPKEEVKPTVTSPIVEKYIESLTGKVTANGGVSYTFKSKEQLDKKPATLSLINDKTGDPTMHITLYTEDGKTFTGSIGSDSLKPGVLKPYELRFFDGNDNPQEIKRQDLLQYDKKSQVFYKTQEEEPIGSPQLHGKKFSVFANYKKIKKGTPVKYTIKAENDKLRDADFLLVNSKTGVYFTQNLSYDSQGNRIVFINTSELKEGERYNVISLGDSLGSDIKPEDVYNEDGWFEVGDEDVRREGPAVTDTVPTTNPGETSKPGEAPKPGKEETLKPSEMPKGDKKETPKQEKDNSWNPFAQGQKAKEGSSEVKSEGGEVATKPVSNRKEGKALPNTGLQTTSYGFLAAIVGLFGAVALRRKNR